MVESMKCGDGTYNAKFRSAGLSSELHDTGCKKFAFSRSSPEPSLHYFGLPARLWKHSEKGSQMHNIVVALLLHKPWVMVPSSGKDTRLF